MGEARWCVADETALDEALVDVPDMRVIAPFGGPPVFCVDVRAEARAAHEVGEELVCDVTQTGPSACPALGMGANVVLVRERGARRALVGFSAVWGPLATRLNEALSPLAAEDALRVLEDADARIRWRARSDAAQVVASYLACHPLVAEVRYPGLRADPSFNVAARTLRGGFGPVLDWLPVGDGDAWHRFFADVRDSREQVLELEGLLATSSCPS